jgi:carbamoyl-phosphate synthase large subunit
MLVRQKRKDLGIVPVVKQIDTLAAEFPAQTNYLYVTYSGATSDVAYGAHSYDTVDDGTPSHNRDTSDSSSSPENFLRRARGYSAVAASATLQEMKQRGVIVLGCGAYCIGSSVEFDWCAVSAIRQLRRDGFKSIIINYNPETVSTDYDESDFLYFEELSNERVLDIHEKENAMGIIVSVGGQIPNNLAGSLSACGVQILGTAARDIERAEDRRQFSAMLDTLGIQQPQWSVLTSKHEAIEFANAVKFPVLVRPSFVLSGAAMRVASDETQLRNFLDLAADVGNDKPVVVTKFILNAKEIEFDAVASKGKILNYAIGEHLENAGVHSGDATVVLPAQKLYVKTIRQVKRAASQIAKALRITGPFNIQFMAKDNEVSVIECNLRASRTVPFVSKTLNCNFISLATKAMVGLDAVPYRISLLDIDYVCVKAPIFSFARLRGADPTLGVEMSSTGEVACFGEDSHEAFLNSMLATTFRLPIKNRSILLSIASDEFRFEFAESVRILTDQGYLLYATPGTAKYYQDNCNIPVLSVLKKPVDESDDCEGTALYEIKQGKIDLVINVSEGTTRKDELTSGYLIRRAAVDFGVSLITNIKCAIQMVECFERGLASSDKKSKRHPPRHIGEYYSIPVVGWTNK